MVFLTLLLCTWLWSCLVASRPTNTTQSSTFLSLTSSILHTSPTALASPSSSLASTPNGNAVPTSTAHPHTTAATTSDANSTTTAPAPANISDPEIAAMVSRRVDFIIAQQSGAKSIPAWLSTLGADGKWPDSEIDYRSGCAAQQANWPATKHWQRIGALSAAWHGGFPGAAPEYVKSHALRAQIGRAMDWWFARDFTVSSCLDTGGKGTCPCGTPGLWNTKWFSNVIGVPRAVGQTCLLLNATLSPTQRANCTHMTARGFDTFQRAEPPSWLTGANALDIASIGIALGMLTADSAVVADAYARVHAEMQVQTGFQADGILEDGSFGQHKGLLYNGNYGKDYSNDVLEVEIEAGGTRFAATATSKAAFECLMDASQWMIYQNVPTGVLHWDFSTEGRFISFPVIDSAATRSININLTEVQTLAELWNSAVLRAVYAGLTTDTATANVGGLVGNRMFWDNDYMVTRGRRYVSTLKMYSSRTRNTECTNSQNPVGFHLADGATYTYVTGAEYEDISAAWDWNLIPGTTVDYGATPLSCYTEKQVGIENFVGGVSDGNLGAAVMRYTNPLTGSLSFQKAWFYFENDIQHVMVSVLDSQSDAPVFSVLDQRTHDGPVYVDNVPVSGGNFSGPRTLFHAATGYLFDDAPQLSVAAGPRTGNWTAIGTSKQPPATVDLFTAWIAHDTRPVAYTVFPARRYPDFVAEAALRPLRTLCHDARVSAVQDRARATSMVAFWAAAGGAVRLPAAAGRAQGTLGVASDSAVVAIVDERAWTVAVADPTQRLAAARLTFELEGTPPAGWGRSAAKVVTVVFPAAPSAGASVLLSLLD